MDIKLLLGNISEFMYILCGLICILTGIKGLKNTKGKIGTFLFWTILGIIFILGKKIPYSVTGGLLLFLGAITVTNQLQPGHFITTSNEFKLEQSEKLKNKIFIPALLIGVTAFLLLQFKIGKVSIPSAVGIGGGAIISLIVGIIIIKPKFSEIGDETVRLLMQTGGSAILPQLLGALGAIFAAAGVGKVISQGVSSIIPENNIIIGIVIYAVGMALFTMIMGNAFAAFAVITAGIGVPFVISQGANPAIIGALGMTAGYCGTLMTPMAANFNIVPAAVLETENKYTIIKTQIPFALILFSIHILLMLLLVFK